MVMTSEFRSRWLEALSNGKFKRKRYDLGGNEGSACVMGVARTVAEEMDLIPKKNVTDQHYLDDEDLRIIGLNQALQHHLASLNDIYIAKDGAYPKRVLNAIAALPVTIPITESRTREPLLISHEK